MALEEKDLKQLAALLGDVLAPRVREAVAENVAARVDALSVRLQDEQKTLVDAALAAMRDSLSVAVQELSTAASTQKYATAQQFKDVEQRILERVQEVNLAVAESIEKTQTDVITATEARLREGLDAQAALVGGELKRVEAAIPEVPPLPEIPAPTKLVEGGELSAAMREAMDIASRQMFGPTLLTTVAPLHEQIRSLDGVVAARLEGCVQLITGLEKNIASLEMHFADKVAALHVRAEAHEGAARVELDRLTTVHKQHSETVDEQLKRIDANVGDVADKHVALAVHVEKVDAMARDIGQTIVEANIATGEAVRQATGEAVRQATEYAVRAMADAETRLGEQIANSAKYAETRADAIEKNTASMLTEVGTKIAASEQARIELSAAVNELTNETVGKLVDSIGRVSVSVEAASAKADEATLRASELGELVITVRNECIKPADVVAMIKSASDEVVRMLDEQNAGTNRRAEGQRAEIEGLIGTVRALSEHKDQLVDSVSRDFAELRTSVGTLRETVEGNAGFVASMDVRVAKAVDALGDEFKAFNGTTAEDLKRINDLLTATADELRDAGTAVANELRAADAYALDRLAAHGVVVNESTAKTLTQIASVLETVQTLTDVLNEEKGFTETIGDVVKGISSDIAVHAQRISEVDTAATVRARAAVQGAEQAVSDALRELNARIDDTVTVFKGDLEEVSEVSRVRTEACREAFGRAHVEAAAQLESRYQMVSGAHDSLAQTVQEVREAVATVELEVESTLANIASTTSGLQNVETHVGELRKDVGHLQQAHVNIEARAVATAEAKVVDAVTSLATDLESNVKQIAEAAVLAQLHTCVDVAERTVKEAVPALVLAQVEPLAVALAPHAEATARRVANEVIDASSEPLRAHAAEAATRVATDACGEAVGAAKAAAEAIAAGALAQVEPLARSAAVEAVPAAVQQCTAELGAATAQIAEDVARGVAEVVGRVGAEAAAQAARTIASEVADDFVEDAMAQVKASTSVIEGALFERVKDAVVPVVLEGMKFETLRLTSEHAAFLEQKLSVTLTEKVQREVDRIPRPRDGEDGDDGKDARVATPVPYEEDKFYEYGAWVTYKAGTWVAARGTRRNPDQGDWDCVTLGMFDVQSELLDDGRSIQVRSYMSDGTVHTNTVKLPVPIQRGVYKEGTYDEHDMVTYDGSQWLAQRSGELPRPGSDATAWRLIVKHGKNGKDGVAPPVRERYRGEWQLETLYEQGDIVGHAGVRWFCNKQTRERPPFTTLVSNDLWSKMGAG